MKTMNYRELYDWGRSALKEAHIQEADLDARLLLEEACDTDRNHLLAHGKEPVAGKSQQCYEKWIGMRRSRIPLQHILGYQEFMGLRFQVTEDVLIPRQDTEILVEEVMRHLQDGMRILDLCTGSGCILLSLLKYSNGCAGVGADLSEKALETARGNAERLNLPARFIQGDLFENVSEKYEIIVSNPPYIPSGEIGSLMEEVRDHDPLMALDGGEDGLTFYRRIVDEAERYLYSGGMLFFEIGCEQASAVRGYMEQAGYRDVTVYKDYAGHDRVVFGRKQE